jgi:hypothetical protein
VTDGVRITVAHKNERLRDDARADNKTSEPGAWAR